MRLKSIKLAGFKSFVDPTTVAFPGNLCAIVGPNGCGKSNIIDAVRWVMGESSAKQLRGEALTDVIFNGSTGRKPTSMASIELLFDNSDGRIGGEYHAFAEIAIRRQVTRDGQSGYFLNGNRCRRRDITDVFLGTGFGPRSYSIIEQGMISQLVEARPEDLRVYLEEAAGISKYKERRKETETRIRHTRENLSRLTDLRDELGSQLARLERQADAAEKYQSLFAEAAQLRMELLALRWRKLGEEIAIEERGVRELEVALDEALARQRRHEAEIEQERAAQTEHNERFNVVQGDYYALGAEVARLEQDIEMRTKRTQELRNELDAAAARLSSIQDDQTAAASNLEQERAQHLNLQPALAAVALDDTGAQATLVDATQLANAARERFETAAQAFGDHQRAADINASRVEHLQQLIQRLDARRAALEAQRTQLDPDAHLGEVSSLEERAAAMDAQQQVARTQLAVLAESITTAQTRLSASERSVEQARVAYQDAARESATLGALQQAALGRRDSTSAAWFEAAGLVEQPRLGEALTVTQGWERALETVLGGALRAAVVDDIEQYAALFATLTRGDVMLVSAERQLSAERQASVAQSATADGRATLASHVHWERPLGGLLGGVYVAATLSEAVAMRGDLRTGESVVTRDGIWLGADWIRAARGEHVEEGILERGQQLTRARQQSDACAAALATAEESLGMARRELRDLEMQRSLLQERLVEDNRTLGVMRADAGVGRARLDALRAQLDQVEREHADIVLQIAAERVQWQQHSEAATTLMGLSQRLQTERSESLRAREATAVALGAAREALASVRERLHELQMQRQAADARVQSAVATVARLEQSRVELHDRRARLEEEREVLRAPLAELNESRQASLAGRAQIEKSLAQVRERIDTASARLRALDTSRAEATRSGNEIRTRLDSKRLAWQDLRTRRGGFADQISEQGGNVELLSGRLEADAAAPEWETRLARVEQRIARLGPINLAAIDEYKTQFERKTYLDAQNADLESALTTLETAIRQIDKETRVRFKETFDLVNGKLQELFPKVFGGGSASLELTGEDLLDTGVTLMARPPGKRNASIHLLSGGEKALTAIALIMSIFHLNPSPVCLLDEVDAPLDDANVGRYAQLITDMASDVQFIFVTHNKIAMEMADQLLGVTMQEPGVSRLVSVDVERAVALAAT